MPKNKKQIREDFRQSVFKRDNFTCKVCNTKRSIGELDAHRTKKGEPNGGYVVLPHSNIFYIRKILIYILLNSHC